MMHTRHMLGVMALTALLPDTPTAAPGELETVIVTATGRPQSGALISAGWSRIEEESLRRTAHTHLNEAVNQVPGTWVSRGNGQEHLTAIRSPVLTGAGGCGSFYMAQDGISLRAPGFCNVNQLFDATSELAQAVEVIRGPGTVRYGSNAMHGVINVVSRDVAENGRGSLRLESGPHDYLRLRFDHSWSGHNQGLRLGASGTSDGGYKDASGFDQQKLNLVHRFTDSTYSLKTVVAASNLNQETAGFVSGKDAYKVDDLKKFNPNPEAFRDAQSWRLHSDINIPLDNGAELHLTPYLRGNEMRFVQHFLPWKAIEENDQHSLGVRLAAYRETTDGSWNLGLDAEATQGSLEEFQPTEFRAAQPQGLHYDYEVDATLAAIYAERRHWLHPQWQADVGVRYEYNGYDYDTLVTPGSPCDPGVSCRFFRPVDRRDSFADWSLNASIAYDYHADHRVYLRAAQGFRAPQATELYRLQQGQSRARLDSEELDSLELGLRGSWSRVEYDVQAWLMKKSNVIFQDSDRQNISGARTEHQGIDLALTVQMSATVELAVTYSYALHRYDGNIELLGSRVDIDGNDIDTAPRHTASARALWLPRPDTQLELEWVHLGRYYTDPANAHRYPGHDLVNMRAYQQLNPQLRIGMRVTNLLDEEYAERADFGFGNERYFVGEPISTYVDIEYRWGDG